MAVDERSQKNIDTLLPEVQPLATKLIEEATAEGIRVKIICGTRTYAEQDKLYSQGRSSPGPIVTKAKGGQSNHNFGLAFDIGIFGENGAYYGEHPDYRRCGEIGEKLGLEWGGDWKFVDEPHFQYNPLNLSIAQMRERTENGESLIA
jgi:peptidoglycan L-alanyl-D-glutamate endopeptidase CwlK